MTLLAGGLSNPALAATATDGKPRPEVIDRELRATLTGKAAGEQMEYLVAVAAAPDVTKPALETRAVAATLKRTAQDSQRPIIEKLKAHGAEVVNTFWLANAILVRSDKDTLTAVTAEQAVRRVYQVQTVQAPEPQPVAAADLEASTVEDRTWGIDRIGAHRVWDELGFDGGGVRVAVLDTGVNIRHPDLAGKMVTDNAADPSFPGGWMEWDASGRPVSGRPRDSQGHGTHVTGTVLGSAAGGTHIGVAPGARLMHGMVLPGGSGTTLQIIAGMQWAIDPYDAQGNPVGQPADVVNMSFGSSSGATNEAFVEPIRNMVAAGVLPVVSSGNCGLGCHGSPGDIFDSLTVGATDAADGVAAFSSGGTENRAQWSSPPASWPDRWVVPDLSAPGVDVLSSIASSFGAPYGRMDGTSMAAPHVAGTAALMLSANRNLTPAQIADALLATSFFDDRHGFARPNERFGQGRIDAFQATSLVALDSGVSGRVVDAATGGPVRDVRVHVVGVGVSMRTVADGRFEFRLPPGSYTLEVFWADRLVSTVTGVTVTTDKLSDVDVLLPGVTGRVTDARSGARMQGVTVEATGTGAGVATGPDGSYRMYLSPGEYSLRLATFGYTELAVPAVRVAAAAVTTADHELAALPTGTISGTVSYVDSGHGIPGVTVTLTGGERSAVTDAKGRFTIGAVPVGTHQIVAKPQQFTEPPARPVTVTAGTTETADFALACGGQCSGLWNARYSGPVATGIDTADATVMSPDGGRLFVAGTSTGSGTDLDVTTVAYEPSTGRQIWHARYDGPSSSQDGANDIAISPDGTRLFVTGLSVGQGNASSGSDYATIAYDAATGAQLWFARYNGVANNFDNARAVDVSPDGTRVFITGQTSVRTGTKSHTDYATIAYDAATGAQLWIAFYDGPSRDYESAVDLVVDPAGGAVYVTGQSPGEGGQSSSAGSGWDYATVAYSAATGAQLWVARYDGPATALDQPAALSITPDGGRLFVTGAATGVGSGAADYATVAYDTAGGTQVWAVAYDGPSHGTDQARAMTSSPDGTAVYVTGTSASDYATVAYAVHDGAQLWSSRYAGPGDGADRAVSIATSPDGSQVIVTGDSAGVGTGTDIATLAYTSSTGAQRWLARYDGPPGDDDTAGMVTVSPDAARVFVVGGSDLGIGDDPAVAPSDFITVAYSADGSARSPMFVAHDLRAVPPVAAAGQPVRVAGEVTNVGTGSGEYDATLVVGGSSAGTTRIALGSGERATVQWSLAPGTTGRHSLHLGTAIAPLHVLRCDRTVSTVHRGPLLVSAGVTCLTSGARILGPVTVAAGAGLLASGATVSGNISADGAIAFSLYETTVTGPVSVAAGSGPVSIVSSDTGPLRVSGNRTGDFPIVVSGNRVRGWLACQDNSPPPLDHGVRNSVTGVVSGQCTGL